MLKVAWLLVGLSFFHVSLGFPNGTSKAHHTCETLRPRHNNSQPQNGTSPYAVTVTNDKVPVGSVVEVFLVSKDNTPFKGFLMLARGQPVRKSRPIGSFRLVDSSRSKLMDCYAIPNSSVCHNSPVDKTKISFKWFPPPNFKGTVYFEATFVKSFSIYWAKIFKRIDVGVTDSETNEIADATATHYQQVYSSSNEVISMSEDIESESKFSNIDTECQFTKRFGIPKNCENGVNCQALVSITQQNSAFEFELLGKSTDYIAVSFFHSGEVDSVIECVMFDQNVVLYTIPMDDSSNKQLPFSVKFLNSSYVDGTVYCKYVKTYQSQIIKTLYFMEKIPFTLTLAAINFENDVDELVTFENIFFNETCLNTKNLEPNSVANENETEISNANNFLDFITWLCRFVISVIRFV